MDTWIIVVISVAAVAVIAVVAWGMMRNSATGHSSVILQQTPVRVRHDLLTGGLSETELADAGAIRGFDSLADLARWLDEVGTVAA
jgi:hypothetical protein